MLLLNKSVCYIIGVCLIVNILMVSVWAFTCDAQTNSLQPHDGSVDYHRYAALLETHVRNGRVDYGGLKKDEASLDAHLAAMETVDADALAHDEQLAFYINLYNAWTIKLILTKWPDIKSIKDFSTLFRSPWERPLVRQNGKLMTLDELEHGIIRPRFSDFRIHFAVNCSARSCPLLPSVPLTGADLQTQLDSAARTFINSPEGVRAQAGKLYVSKIFKWYAEDFTPSVEAVIRQYAEPDLSGALKAATTPLQIHYLDYNWQLNGNTP